MDFCITTADAQNLNRSEGCLPMDCKDKSHLFSCPLRGPSLVCHILRLPIEIRIIIYENLFGVSSSDRVKVSIFSDQHASSDSGLAILGYSLLPAVAPDLRILRSNKYIYTEALPILYTYFYFFPKADQLVMKTWLTKMSAFARSNVQSIHLKPLPCKIIRTVGPEKSDSQVSTGPCWAPTCAELANRLPNLQELFIHLHTLHGLTLERHEDLDWVIRPLSRLHKIKKTLSSVGSSDYVMTKDHVDRWGELVKKADMEAKEYALAKSRITQGGKKWPSCYWREKRAKLKSLGKSKTSGAKMPPD